LLGSKDVVFLDVKVAELAVEWHLNMHLFDQLVSHLLLEFFPRLIELFLRQPGVRRLKFIEAVVLYLRNCFQESAFERVKVLLAVLDFLLVIEC